MEASERDSTQDWELPERRRPLLIGEIEAKVDVAIAIARASAEGVREVGDAALDAAKQARQAAEMAQAASAAAAEARDAVATAAARPEQRAAAEEAQPAPDAQPAPVAQPPLADGLERGHKPRPLSSEARLSRFSERCDRLSARLRALERRPGTPAATGVAEARHHSLG